MILFFIAEKQSLSQPYIFIQLEHILPELNRLKLNNLRLFYEASFTPPSFGPVPNFGTPKSSTPVL